MITATIELWDANDNFARKTLHQVVIGNVGRYIQRDNSFMYVCYLLKEGVKIPIQGEKRAQVPDKDKILAEVMFRHEQDDSDLEIFFRALRELRQNDEGLFINPDKEATTKGIRRAVFS